MASTIIARRYAEAYFALALEANAIDAWRTELNRAVDTLANDEVQRALANPRLPMPDRVRLADDLLDGSSAQVRSLIRLLIERGRINNAPMLLPEYDRLADRQRGVVHVEVISAVPLNDALRATVTSALGNQVTGSVDIGFKEDASIIGGVIVRIGDRVIDGSVRTHLQQLQASLA